MSCPRLVIPLVAGVLATTPAAFAQPILSPRDVTDPPAKAADPMPPEARPETPKAEAAKAEAAKAEAAKPEKPAEKHAAPAKHATKSAKPKAKSTRSKSTAAAKSSKSSKSGTAKKPSTKAKAKAKAKPAKASSATAPAGARVAAVPMRGGRADNMPRGFVWPASRVMQAASKSCEADLDTLGVTWKHAAAEGRMVDAVEIPDGMLGGVKYTSMWQAGAPRLDCQLARVLAQVGKDLHALGVREVKWGSIYRWSNVRTQGTTMPYLSRHALGLAMDIVELVDDTGRVANVKRDYPAGDSLLLDIEKLVNTSGRFRILLTPKNDPKSHHDHFHIEANPDYSAP